MTQKYTPTPWFVRNRKSPSGDLLDCFVAAKDVNGYPYDAEILGDDEYHDTVLRKEADCNFIVRACNAHDDLVKALEALYLLAKGEWPRDLHCMKSARKALAKARGESK